MSQSDFVSRGQALVAAGQFQEAVKVCRLGLLGRPTTVEGRVVLGQALLALKRYDEVLAEMRVALELDHSSTPAQVLRAEALLRKGDTHAAIEALHKARQMSPGDQRVMQLLGEAEHGGGRASVTHPAVGFVGSGDTKHYPGHTSGRDDEAGRPDNYTQPTSLASPGGGRRSSQRSAAVEPDGRTQMTPPPVLFDVGDKSGTLEVDPESEGIEVPGDPDFDDDVAAPPVGKRPAQIGGERGSVKSSRTKGSTIAGKKSAQSAQPISKPVMTQSLPIDDDDLEEVEETPMPVLRRPGPGTAVRNAVAMPSGVIGEFGPSDRAKPSTLAPPSRSNPLPPPRGNPSAPPPMALGMPPAPLPPAPRAPIAAALPTVAAAQPPPLFVQQQAPYPPTPASLAASARPTLAIQAEIPPLSVAQQQSALAVDQLFGNDQQQNWGQAPHNAANEPTARPGELDPQILALMSGGAMNSAEMPPPAAPLVAMENIGFPHAVGMRTGVRKVRSRLQIAMWILIGALVIGGGVFAGFKIRGMRLDNQIEAARKRATDLAKSDTWGGWTAARDGLSGIVGASSTLSNRAALARTRALIAYEFGDGVPEAKDAVAQLAGNGGLDSRVAAAYIALLGGEVKATKAATEAAVAGSDGDAGAQYVAAEAALLAGDTKTAIAAMKLAFEKEPRPLFGVGLARAYAAAYDWDEAVAAIDKVRSTAADHPGTIIARSMILAASGRIGTFGPELKGQLEQLIAESRQPAAQQARGVSPTQGAFASIALARVELARGDINAARKAVRGATDINLDDVRFAEEAVKTLYVLGDLTLARTAGELAMKMYPASARVRISYSEVLLAQGRANEAVELLGNQADTMVLADALAARGHAYLALGDPANAGADFDAALKKIPTHEPSIVGRAWLELATNDLESATKRMAERMNPKGASLAVMTAYAATLRATDREAAKQLLEKIVSGPAGPDAVRAQLELARIYRDQGEYTLARPAYDKAARNGGLEARFEGALLSIEYSKPMVGRDALEALYTEAGERPSAQLVIETARARLLVGDHVRGEALLARADTMSSVERYKLDRERGRLALHKADFAAASAALSRALDTCGGDAETFLLAADVAIRIKDGLREKVKQLAPARLKGQPELHIVNGKLLIDAEKMTEAAAAYQEAAKISDKGVKLSNRRSAQIHFGQAVIAYYNENQTVAERTLDLVIDEDPTIVEAYMFAAEIARAKNDKKNAYKWAKLATQYNPDNVAGWKLVGSLASEMRDKRQLVDAIARLMDIAPDSEELKELQKLKK